MPSRANYVLLLAGRLKGDQVGSKIMNEIQAAFPKPEPKEYAGAAATDEELKQAEKNNDKLGAGWPGGFVLKDYKVCDWRAKPERYGQYETLFAFRAEIHHTREKSLFDNRETMLRHVSWFYNYRLYTWHGDLVKTLQDLNTMIKKHKEDLLIAPIWFSSYQWYCGNGGP